jgi:Transglycosylase SLT domain
VDCDPAHRVGVAAAAASSATRALLTRLALDAVRAKGVLLAGAAAVVLVPVLVVLLLLAALSGANVQVGASCHAGGANASEIPPQFLPLYDSAAAKYELGERGPAVLVSMHRTESGFGTNMGPSSAGAEGHMQFIPSTWRAYGVDADRDGSKDPYSATDAVYAAARYLRASGAPGDWRRAVFAYNHADWYVDLILDGATGFQGACEQTTTLADGPGELPSDRLERLVYVASWIDRRRYPYCWGGGHGPAPGPSSGSYCWSTTGKVFGSADVGLDCSGAVRWLLTLTGYRDTGGIASSSFTSAYPSGRGRVVTIWANPSHVFIHVRGRGYWGTTQANHRHGPGWIRTYPTSGFTPVHPPGL